ncbi:MAG: dihydrolipoyllysine-residue acetyltransferase [Thiobacillaceae bacterium]|nr:dihydrolipoyllysine-residue acetyltransferase [Thiobacillaceae bacterium]MCX7672170.1 dihydrolipoyllysine-residue acetyltransferase [Thiobacillaceae bacterium]MDW8323887.1 dihydrolipoyllysine-residue acetyltransferase [Burkholderiales bacterium]
MAIQEVRVPDIGNFKDVPVIDILVKPGDKVHKNDPLITLESDKAAMDIPAPVAGTVQEIKLKVGDKVSEGSPILLIDTAAEAPAAASPVVKSFVPPPAPESGMIAAAAAQVPPPSRLEPEVPGPIPPAGRPAPVAARAEFAPGKPPHASPSVRRFARELGVDLARVKGSGPRGRILKTDVQAWVKAELSKPRAEGAGFALGLPPAPVVDFSQWGEVETQPLTRIKKLSGANLARNWVIAPHVTQFDEADITDLESFRKSMLEEAAKRGVKLTLLAFLMKAVVNALRHYPQFNASLAPDGDRLILKKYYHIGFACETPDGLVVPVIREVNRKDVLDIARELGDLSARARERKLKVEEMQGGCFTITSLGGIGGTAFTPIINVPEVAILGVSRAVMKPVWNDKAGEFEPRLMLPLSLSYDHRVIDGADGARFTSHLRLMLSDVRRLLL